MDENVGNVFEDESRPAVTDPSPDQKAEESPQ